MSKVPVGRGPTQNGAVQTVSKVLGIKVQYRDQQPEGELSRGESIFSVNSADTYVEEEPSTWDWLREHTPNGKQVVNYFTSLLPFLKWIHRYNLQWLIGDLVAGITIGAVVVPQSMSYAGIAELDAQFGLYSSFMGVLIYWFFSTSKDITIGPVAVMSQLVGNIVLDAQVSKDPYINDLGNNSPNVIASCLAIIAGGIICFLGLVRLGFIVDFISATAISAFITGAAITIASGQVIKMLGISSDLVNTHGPTYLIIIDTLKYLPTAAGLDAAMGMTALFALYLWRYLCNLAARKWPNRARLFFFISTTRTAIVVLFYTMVSWLANMNIEGLHDDENDGSDLAIFAILGPVPRGFQNAGVPTVNSAIISFFASKLPATVIVLLIEHIAISKSFGRINNYTINPSQELIAIGITNLLGPFLGAYPATGSFSRTAIKSKAGVRTPLAGVVTAIVVLLAIYALPAVFFYIPQAALGAVIFHAVGDLIAPPNTVYQFWRVNPIEVIIFFAGVIVTIFTTIEDGIYVTVSLSAGVLLFRLAKARGRFLGKVKVHSVIGDHIIDAEPHQPAKSDIQYRERQYSGSEDKEPNSSGRTVFLPMDHRDGHNPSVQIQRPYPGVFVYRFSEGLNYPNANHYLEHMVQTIFKETRRTNPFSYARPGDRPWNAPGPKKGQEETEIDYSLPTLKAVVLDFSSVNNVDVTVMQQLIDVRNQLDRYASPDTVEFHLAAVNNRWTKRALVSSGFGYPTPTNVNGDFNRWKPIFSVAEFGGHSSAAEAAQNEYNQARRATDAEHGIRPVSGDESSSSDEKGGYHSAKNTAVVNSMNRPFFHIDVMSALQSAIASIERRKELKPTEQVVQESKQYQ